MLPTDPPTAVDFMFAPNAEWFAAVDSAGIPDAYVDSILNATLQAAARVHGVMCRTLKRHDDIEHINRAKDWPIRHYEPRLGWFYWRECGPVMRHSETNGRG